jgi:hypothetical protein
VRTPHRSSTPAVHPHSHAQEQIRRSSVIADSRCAWCRRGSRVQRSARAHNVRLLCSGRTYLVSRRLCCHCCGARTGHLDPCSSTDLDAALQAVCSATRAEAPMRRRCRACQVMHATHATPAPRTSPQPHSQTVGMHRLPSLLTCCWPVLPSNVSCWPLLPSYMSCWPVLPSYVSCWPVLPSYVSCCCSPHTCPAGQCSPHTCPAGQCSPHTCPAGQCSPHMCPAGHCSSQTCPAGQCSSHMCPAATAPFICVLLATACDIL